MGEQRFRKELKEILSKTVLLEGIPEEERVEILRPMRTYIDSHLPSSLFRYRSCSEMNIDAFNEDKLYAVTPDKFNDPYDSLFRYDKEKLRESALLCTTKDYIVSLRKYLQSGADFPEVLHTLLPQELLDNFRSNLLNVNDEAIEVIDRNIGPVREALSNSIDKLTDEAVKTVKQLASIACFSETISSVTMWSHYADSHKGFALEYDTSVFWLKCQYCDKNKHCNQAAVCKIYPVVYDKQRYDATDFLAWFIAKGLGVPIKNSDTFAASKCLLFKSPQWSYEREWRLIINRKNDFLDKSPVCIYKIRPKAIYYGVDISPINKKLLHMIAKEKGIAEYQMDIDAKSFNYAMKVRKLHGEVVK